LVIGDEVVEIETGGALHTVGGVGAVETLRNEVNAGQTTVGGGVEDGVLGHTLTGGVVGQCIVGVAVGAERVIPETG
jgi:hypothetical protein